MKSDSGGNRAQSFAVCKVGKRIWGKPVRLTTLFLAVNVLRVRTENKGQ